MSFAWTVIEMQDVLQQVGKAIKLTDGAEIVVGELSSYDEQYLYIMTAEQNIVQFERDYYMGVTFTAAVATPLEDLI